jgi:microcystin degradation protein MlrC
MARRVFGGGIWTETNVFSPMPTGLREFVVARPGDGAAGLDRPFGGSAFTRFAEVAAARGYEYVQGTYAAAGPAGLTTRAAYESLRDTLLQEVAAARPLDGVLLSLHGAMVAEGYEDCETDLVTRVRELVGGDARIGVVLDPHCDLPHPLLERADVVLTYKEYPHIDIEERAAEVANLTLRAAAGEIDPRSASFDCRMIGTFPTRLEPMRSFVDTLKETEQRPGVLSVSLGHGFPWGDAPAMGARVLVIADGDEEIAESVAEELGHAFFALRHAVSLRPLSMHDALDQALAPGAKRPVVIADIADNSGGGAPSDSTFVLAELLARGAENVALALLWDPVVVQQAFAAGVGSRLAVRLGGKMGPASGRPLDLSVEVRALVPDLVQRWPQTKGYLDSRCGDCARLRCDGVDIVVSSIRAQVLGLEVYTAFDIDPTERDVLIAKSSNHFRAALEPVAGEILYMTTPGALNFDYASVPYRLVDPNKYPFVDDPWQ